MSQVIVLPDSIVERFSQMGLPLCADKAKTQIESYTKEVALVAIILSDNYMKQLYEKTNSGYMACIDELHSWAVEYVTNYAHVEEWEAFLDTDRTFGECVCWDDHVIAFGNAKIQNL